MSKEIREQIDRVKNWERTMKIENHKKFTNNILVIDVKSTCLQDESEIIEIVDKSGSEGSLFERYYKKN